jgi:hypothetical protein
MMTYLILGLIILEFFLTTQARAAVPGSRQRYVLLAFRRIASWAVNLAFIGEGIVAVLAGQTVNALWYLLLGFGGIVLEIRLHRNDDDWFNGRGTKIRKWIKRALTAPRPVAAPAPAFG